jgi:hypothetical protein
MSMSPLLHVIICAMEVLLLTVYIGFQRLSGNIVLPKPKGRTWLLSTMIRYDLLALDDRYPVTKRLTVIPDSIEAAPPVVARTHMH